MGQKFYLTSGLNVLDVFYSVCDSVILSTFFLISDSEQDKGDMIIAGYCRVLQGIAVYCRVLQGITMQCNAFYWLFLGHIEAQLGMYKKKTKNVKMSD